MTDHTEDQIEEEEPLADDDMIVISRAFLTNVAIAVVFLLLGMAIGGLFGTGIVLANSNTITAALAEPLAEGVVENLALDAPAQAQPQPQPQPSQGAVPVGEISIDDDPTRGPEDAPVVIVEFSDFRCPFCQRFHAETLPQLLDDYGDQILYVFRDFPVVGGQRHAEAAGCASEQGAFWPFHDELFLNPSAYASQDDFVGLADDLQLDVSQFTSCVENRDFSQEVAGDVRDAQQYGVTGTPTFFINGERVVGAQPYATFAEAIENALAEAGGR